MAVDFNKYSALYVSLAAAILMTLVMNILFLFVYIRRKKMRLPSKYPLASLSIISILSAFGWSVLTTGNVMVTNGSSWSFDYSWCKLQVFFYKFFALASMHTLTMLGFERVFKIYYPSRHEEIFQPKVIPIALFGLWLTDSILAFLPVHMWGVVYYDSAQFQCNMNHDANVRQMNFSTAVTFGIPIIAIAVCYVMIFIRVKRLRDRMTPEGAMIVEVNDYASGDSYADRLKKQQLKFKDAGRKKKKPVVGPKLIYTDDGYESLSDSSDEEDGKIHQEGGVLKRVYYLSKKEYTLVKTYLIVTLLFILLWYPHIIVSYVRTYEWETVVIPDNVITILVWLTHATLFINPIVYFLHNQYLRRHLKKAFGCGRRHKRFASLSYSKIASQEEE